MCFKDANPESVVVIIYCVELLTEKVSGALTLCIFGRNISLAIYIFYNKILYFIIYIYYYY